MKAILRSINNFSCKLKQSNNLKYNISPKIRSNKFKNISGNGSLVIEDALSKSVKDYKIYGNTYQKTISGKNLLDDKNITARTHCTVDNGVITTTPLARASLVYVNINDIPLKVGDELYTTFKVRLKSGTATKLGYGGRLYDGTTYATNTGITPTGVSDDFVIYSSKQTVSTDIIAKQMVFQAANVAGVSDAVYEIKDIIVSTNPIDTYEEYTGGQPSPNPDYPQEIVSCGDRTKNLFLASDTPASAYRATYSKINKNSFSLNYNQENSSNNSSYVRIDFDVSQFKPNTQYTISKKHIVSGNNFSNAGAIRSYINGSNGSVITGDSFTFTTPNEITSLGVYFYLGYNNTIQGESTITFYDIQIEENSSVTPYEPYGCKIPVNVRSENLFNNNDTSILLKAYISPTTLVSSNNSTTLFVNCKPNTTYTITRSIIGKRFGVGTTDIIPIVGDSINNVKPSNVNNELSTITYTTNSTAKYLCVFYSNTGGNNLANNNGYTEEELRNSLQIVEGSTVPSKYIPYYNEITNIYLDEPLRKIDEYSDYIDFINGKVVRNIKEYTLIGDEQIKMIREGMNCIKIDGKNIRTESLAMPPIFCNMLLANNRDSIYQGNVGIGYGEINNEYYNDIVMRVPNITTLTDFTTWLQSNNVTVDYVLATPTEGDIELPNINLIEGKNIITIGTELESIIEVEYYSKEIIDISDYKYNLRKVED